MREQGLSGRPGGGSRETTPPNIAIIAGEASGDRVGAALAREIQRLRPDIHLWGTGGKHLQDADVEVIIDSARWGVIGLAAGLRILPQVLAARRVLHQELLRRRPSLIIPIDAGAFNVGFPAIEGLCPYVRRNLPGTKIFYYFPPSSWRRTLKKSPLAAMTDMVVTPFPWSEKELRRFGVNASFVGHPLLDLVKPTMTSEAFADAYGIDRTRPVVGILPGSRTQEIENLLPVQLGAAGIIHQRVPSVQFLIALAPTVDRAMVEAAIRRAQEGKPQSDRHSPHEPTGGEPALSGPIPVTADGSRAHLTPAELEEQRKKWLARAAEMPENASGAYPIAIVEDKTYDVMSASDVLLITSGTATLEAAILGRPMVITYRMSSDNFIEYHLVKNKLPKFVGMPNILAERGIVPEYIQDAATPESLAGEVIGLLLEPDRMLRMREELRTVTALLGQPGATAKAAKMVVELLEQNRGNVRPASSVE